MIVETDKKDAYLEKLEARKQELAADLKKLEARLKRGQAEAKLDYRELIDDLEQSRERLTKRIRGLEEASADSWESFKTGAEEALTTLVTGMAEAKERLESEFQES